MRSKKTKFSHLPHVCNFEIRIYGIETILSKWLLKKLDLSAEKEHLAQIFYHFPKSLEQNKQGVL